MQWMQEGAPPLRFMTHDWRSSTNDVNPMDATVSQVTAFFAHLFTEGRQAGTIRNYRSAIASIHRGFADKTTVGNNPLVAQVLKGMFNKRPPTRRLAPSWSINDVLAMLAAPPYEPLSNTPLELLTYKTLFLIAAASARRRGCLHALTTKREFLRFDPSGVRLLPDPEFLAKNQSASFTPKEIYLPSMQMGSSIAEDKFYCPVRALKWYLERTKQIRSSEKLFILPRRPFTPASKSTLSRWIVNLIKPFTEEGERVRAHDLRGHATSKAWFGHIHLEDIMSAAAWKTPSTFVSHYLTDILTAEGAFARSVLRAPGRRVPVPPPFPTASGLQR